MRVYTVHVDPLSADADRGAVLVREGFNWAAALLSVVWALYHRLWGVALILLTAAAALGIGAAALGVDLAGRLALDVGYAAVVGYTANDGRRWTLARRGLRMVGVVAGDDRAGAERRALERLAAAGP